LQTTTLTLTVPACSVLTYSSPSGERFPRSSFGAKTSISSLTLDFTTNGVRKVSVQGYQ